MSGRASSRSGKRLAVIISLSFAALLAVLAWSGAFVSYESPDYRVVDRLGEVEVREYDGYLVARTRVAGDLERAGNQGFRIVGSYIFGDNQSQTKIEMTAPVTQREETRTKIEMTAPVTQQEEDGSYVISFMMPSEFSQDTLPEPIDPRVEIAEVPPMTMAAIRYSGTWSQKNYQRHLDRLLAELGRAGYEAVGEPVWARYNAPYTPWFMRRNEILTSFRAHDEAP